MNDEKLPKGERTETTVRKYDAKGRLVSETVQITVTVKPELEPDDHTGLYL